MDKKEPKTQIPDAVRYSDLTSKSKLYTHCVSILSVDSKLGLLIPVQSDNGVVDLCSVVKLSGI